MQLLAYPLSPTPPVLRPASPARAWMDRSPQRFAYRCLPLTIANSYGWEILSPSTFTAIWLGGDGLDAIRLLQDDGTPPVAAVSHFGIGILTFHVGYLFRTPAPYGLMVGGSPNFPIDGAAPLSGLVETAWLPFPFTMNYQLTRPGVPVRFHAGDPICHLYPVDLTLLASVQPALRDLASDPTLAASYRVWAASRGAFNASLRPVPHEAATAAQVAPWQRFYTQGTSPDGTPAPAHLTKLTVLPFSVVGVDPPA